MSFPKKKTTVGAVENGERIRAASSRIEAALTRNALAQPRWKALDVARRITERGKEWERAEIARAEAHAARLRARKADQGSTPAQNVPDGTTGLETA